MTSMVINIPAEVYEQLEAHARQTGTTPEALAREFLKIALHAHENPQPQTAREVLQSAGRVRPLSNTLRCQIIPGVTLDEVRDTFSKAAGPALSDIVQAQRGLKP